MYVASTFDRLVGRYMGGPFGVYRFSESTPYATPARPGSTPGLEPGIAPSRLSASHTRTLRTLLGCQLPPRAVAAPRELSVSSKGAILPAGAEAIYGALASQFS